MKLAAAEGDRPAHVNATRNVLPTTAPLDESLPEALEPEDEVDSVPERLDSPGKPASEALEVKSKQRQGLLPKGPRHALGHALGSTRYGDTDVRQLREALEQSEERLRALTDNLPNVAIYQCMRTAGGATRFNYLSEGIYHLLGVPIAEAMANPYLLYENIDSRDILRFREAEEHSAKNQTVFQMEARIRTRSNQTKWLHWRSAPIRLENGDTLWNGVVADITERKTAERALHRANRAVLMLKECSETLVRAVDEAELLNRICQIVVEVGDAQRAWVGFSRDDRFKTVQLVASAGGPDRCLEDVPVTWANNSKGQGPTALAIRTEKVQIVRNIEGGPHLPSRGRKSESGFAAVIAIPIPGKSRCLGALTIYSSHPRAFNQEEVILFKQLADDLSYGILARRSNEQREQLQIELLQISEREKHHIAQELHDGLCQHLAGAAMMANLLSRRLALKGLKEADSAGYLCELLNTSMTETRNLAHGLFLVRGEEGLMDALAQLASTTTHLFQIRCTFTCVRPVTIASEEVATHLFRIVQEAINNGIKHGSADRISIVLGRRRNEIKLVIRDNGSGLPAELPTEGGMGLKIMNHRAAAIGASVMISRAARRGTLVVCTLQDPATRKKRGY